MAQQKPKPTLARNSKAACEAAGWKFLPISCHAREEVWKDGEAVGMQRIRIAGGRGVEAVPPVGCGIEPRHFGGTGRAVAWAVGQLGKTAGGSAEHALVGMDGIRLMLAAALASGEVCGGPDETPERPDARLLAAAHDVGGGHESVRFLRRQGIKGPDNALGDVLSDQAESARLLCTLPATTRDGLIWKARAALAAVDCSQLVARERLELFQSLALDLIELVPTMIDERGRAIMPLATQQGAGGNANDNLDSHEGGT